MIPTIVLTVVASIWLLASPRRYAAMPLLLVAVYTTRMPVVNVGPANLSALRILILVGFVRVLVRREYASNGLNAIDIWLLAWATLLVITSAFHTSDAWTFRLGMVLGELGVYFLLRALIRSPDDVRRLFAALCVMLLPLAVLMLVEKYTAHNPFEVMGGSPLANIRDGHVRAYGPFAHAILAGTVGATCLGPALVLWREHRTVAIIGLIAAMGIVYASTSSGPIMMVAFTIVGVMLWRVRANLRLIRWGTAAAIVALQVVMKDPVYFLMARIDITGGSTGWHRAELIRSSIDHLNEWWLVGTDYTRHWMPTGIHANEIHTDITNHILAMGVLGGLPLVTLFLAIIVAAFRSVGRSFDHYEAQSGPQAFLAFALGAMLFGQVMNFFSISLFDQSVTFFYLVLVAISAVRVPSAAVTRSRSAALSSEAAALARVHLPISVPAMAGRLQSPRPFRRPVAVGTHLGKREWVFRRSQ